MNVTRYIIDMEQYGAIYMDSLQSLFQANESYRDINHYNETIGYIYSETGQQIFLLLSNDHQDFALNLISCVDWRMFSHMVELHDQDTRSRFIEAFKEFGLGIFFLVHKFIIDNEFNKGNNIDYLLDVITPTYMIVSKTER